MATQTCYPGTVVNYDAGNGRNWVDANNVKASDGVFSTVNLDGWDLSNFLKCTNFGFAIPSGATINSIRVNIKGKAITGGAINVFSSDTLLRLSDGTIYFGSPSYNSIVDAPSLTTTNTEYNTYGIDLDTYSESLLWDRAWSASDINDADFGCNHGINTDPDPTCTVYIDFISITVDYTETGGSSAIKSVNGLAKASVKSFNGLAIASVKNINGLE